MIDVPMNRWKVRRGSELPWAKLDEHAVRTIRAEIRRREELRLELRGLTNAALATRYGVHERTIDRISAGEGWCHVE